MLFSQSSGLIHKTSSAVMRWAKERGTPKKPMRFCERQTFASRWALQEREGVTTLFYRFLSTDIGLAHHAADPVGEIKAALGRARQRPNQQVRVVIVGTDTLFSSQFEAAEGRSAAMAGFASLLEQLGRERVPFTWRTRGGLGDTRFPANVAEALELAGPLAQVQVGICSLDDGLVRALEGRRGAKVEERLRLMGALSARGIFVSALLDPLVPMLTDQPAAIRKILSKLSAVGVFKVSARYFVLTRRRAKALSKTLTPMNRDLLRGCFAEEPWVPGRSEDATAKIRESHKLLPPHLRRNGHRRIEDEGAQLGLVVEILDAPTADEVERREGKLKKRRVAARRVRKPVITVPQLDLFGIKVVG